MLLSKKEKKFGIFLVIVEFSLITGIMKLMLSGIKTNGVWELVFSYLLLMVVFPLFVSKVIFQKDTFPGISVGTQKKKIIISAIVALVFFAIVEVFMVELNIGKFLNFSPWVKSLLAGNKGMFFFFELILLPLVVFSKEYFFRGIVLGFLEKNIGPFLAIFFQALMAIVFEAVFNWGSHYGNFLLLYISNLFLGWSFLYTRSILVSFAIHFCYVVLLDITIVNLIK